MQTSHKVAIVGGGVILLWWLNRDTSPAVVQQEGADKLTANVGDDVNSVKNDAFQIAGEVASGATGKVDLGGSSAGGDQGGVNPVVEFNGPCGESGIKVDHAAPGNQESSTQNPNVPIEDSAGSLSDIPYKVWNGDLMNTYMQSKYGMRGASGMTKRQISAAYGELAAMSGEVF